MVEFEKVGSRLLFTQFINGMRESTEPTMLASCLKFYLSVVIRRPLAVLTGGGLRDPSRSRVTIYI